MEFSLGSHRYVFGMRGMSYTRNLRQISPPTSKWNTLLSFLKLVCHEFECVMTFCDSLKAICTHGKLAQFAGTSPTVN